MKSRNRALPELVLPLAGAILLSACASGDHVYPSLAIGERGRASGSMTVPPTGDSPAPVVSEVPPAQLDQLLAAAQLAQRSFAQSLPAARKAVDAARGTQSTSDRWAVAQIALANLEASRSQAMVALADLDRLHVDSVNEGRDDAATAAARSEVAALVGEQDRQIGALLAGLN